MKVGLEISLTLMTLFVSPEIRKTSGLASDKVWRG